MVPARYRILRSWQFIRCALTLFSFVGLCLFAQAAGETSFDPPEALPSDRYSPIWERSPFELKTTAIAAVNTGSFAENLTLAGLSDVEGEVTVYLKDKSSGAYVKLTNLQPSDSGISFDKIVEDPNPREVKVSLRKGGETALVGYAIEQVGPGSGGPGAPPGASALTRKPPIVPPGPMPPAGAAPGADPASQQKSRRRIILPQAQGAPQSSFGIPSTGSLAFVSVSFSPFS